jgi:hypothetical protein
MHQVSDVFGKKEFLSRTTQKTGYPPHPGNETRSAKSPLINFLLPPRAPLSPQGEKRAFRQ